MYLNYFNLKREPFNITPDPELLYLGPSHREALAAVIYGVTRRKGFVAIIGEVGVGKTTIIRSFLDRIDKQNVKTIYIFNANISFKTLLRTIYENMGWVPQTDDVADMVNQLHMILIDEYKAGRNVVLIIDEAQNMPLETLENLRMLSNLETATDKLIQIVFSGQPEFEQKLQMHTLRQLNQRIAVRVKILPLSRAESLEYINYRLCRSLVENTDLFTPGALNRIVGKAGGIPRIINILCDNCLITSFGNQQKKVTTRVAREIIAEQGGAKEPRLGWQIACITAFLVAVCAFLFYVKNGRAVPMSVPTQSDKKPGGQVADRNNIQADQPAPVKTVGVLQDEAAPKAVMGKYEQAGLEEKPGNGSSRIIRVAKRGDTLAKLVMETYGLVDRNLLELVRQNNPRITNINVIQEGEKIFFPTRDR
jgi:general secretion pathway protein A